MMMPRPCPSSSRLLKTFFKFKKIVYSGKMTRGPFSIGQSWNFEFHKVKLLNYSFSPKDSRYLKKVKLFVKFKYLCKIDGLRFNQIWTKVKNFKNLKKHTLFSLFCWAGPNRGLHCTPAEQEFWQQVLHITSRLKFNEKKIGQKCQCDKIASLCIYDQRQRLDCGNSLFKFMYKYQVC